MEGTAGVRSAEDRGRYNSGGSEVTRYPKLSARLIRFGLVWFGLVWVGLVWFGLVTLGLVRFGLARFGTI